MNAGSSAFHFRFILIACLGLFISCSDTVTPREAFENQQYELAHELWLPRAQAGNAEAQNAIGTLYYLGLGVRRHYKTAFEWFDKAAHQGHPGAQRNLGMMYQDGRGTEQDYVKAYSWFYAANKQGNKGADAYIDNLANKLTPNQQIQAKRTADQYIVNPIDDYLPVPAIRKADPQVEDMRESS